MLPTFFILGAAKCGTTSLHELLAQHPDVCMSNPKEPLFFEAEFENGPEFYMEKYFSHCCGEKEIGESRHRNLYLPHIPDRIRTLAPDARFIVLARHPVDRAWSHWWHWYVRGVEANSFEAAIRRNLVRIEGSGDVWSEADIARYAETLDRATGFSPLESYVDSGYYARQIRRYADRFGPDRVKILLFEDFVADPRGTAGEVFAFLGLPAQRIANVAPHNVSAPKRGHGLLDRLGCLPGVRRLPREFRRSMRNAVSRILGDDRPRMAGDTRAMLVEHYEPHIRELEEMTGRSLPHWRS